jgi:hypothetical protein
MFEIYQEVSMSLRREVDAYAGKMMLLTPAAAEETVRPHQDRN